MHPLSLGLPLRMATCAGHSHARMHVADETKSDIYT